MRIEEGCMEKGEAEFFFHEADRLFKEEHFLEALQYLAALDNEFPGNFNILFPIVLCCERLGRIDEAYEHCSRLFEQFPSENHQEKLQNLYGRICRQQQARMRTNEAITAATPAHEFVKDTPKHVELKRTGAISLGNWDLPLANVIIGLSIFAVFFVLLSLLIPMVHNEISEEQPHIQYSGFALMLLIQFMLACIIAYAALWVMNKRIHEELIYDVIDVCIAIIIFMLISAFVPLIGSFVGIYFLARHYEMGFWEAIIFLFLQVIFHMLFLYVMLPLVFGEGALNLIELL